MIKEYTWNELKEKYPDTLILIRLGDFYELYGEDAVQASNILHIQLTKSQKWKHVAGFPCHALDDYLPKLVRAGKRVAIYDGNDLKIKEEKKMENVNVIGIVTETIKALKGELPSTLANYLYDAIGKLEVIKIKHNLNLTPNKSEIAYLIEQAEINNGQ